MSDQYPPVGKRPLAIAEMNAELPPFKNGEHNSESASALDRDITPFFNLNMDYSNKTIRMLGETGDNCFVFYCVIF